MEESIAAIISQARKSLQDVPTTQRFTLTMMTADDVFPLMSDAYEAEVRNRNCTMRQGKGHKQLLRLISAWLTDENMKPGILLYGGVGNGKTTAATAIYEAISSIRDAASYARDEYIKSLGYVNRVPKTKYDSLYKLELPQMITAKKLSELAQDTDRTKLEQKKTCGFLIIDDLGCEPMSVKTYGTELTPVADIIYYRYDVMLPTVFTTNLDMDGIKSFYGERVSDRLREFCEMIAFTGNSYRK